jgi:hypothetical protein
VSAKDAARMDALVKTLLKASAPAILKQLKTNCKDHLPQGKYWNPSEEMKKQMAGTPLHNDRMERNFAYLDRAMVRSPNASFFTVSSSAAWVANGTSSWVRGLVAVVRELLVKFAIRQGRSDRAQSKVDVAASAAQKAERKAVDARKAKRSLIRKIRVFHQLCDEEVFTNSKQLTAFIKEQDGNPKAIEKEIRQQLRILVEVYGYNRSQDLFVLSGKTYAGILAAYKNILKPLKKRILEAQKRSPTAALVSSLPLFRNGTSSAKAKALYDAKCHEVIDLTDKVVIQKLSVDEIVSPEVAPAMESDASMSAAAAQTSTKTCVKKKKKLRAPRRKWIGGRLAIPFAYWCPGDPDPPQSIEMGVIRKSHTWTYKGVALKGFRVRFHDGLENIPMADAERYFVTPE